MKPLLVLFLALAVGCRPSGKAPPVAEPAPVITAQQLQCLNQRRDAVEQSIAAHRQVFAGRDEDDVPFFTTPEGRVVGYLFEQGECSTVMTRIPPNQRPQAEAFIAAEVSRNYGPMFITPAKVSYKLYIASTMEGTNPCLVAQSPY